MDSIEYVEMPVRITKTEVFIGDERIPGCIADGGITVNPGGTKDINCMTIEFIVGKVIVE